MAEAKLSSSGGQLMHPGAWVRCQLNNSKCPGYGYLVNMVSDNPETWKVMLVQDGTDVMSPEYLEVSNLKLLDQRQFISLKK